MSRFAQVEKAKRKNRKNDLEIERELNLLLGIGERYLEKQRDEFEGNLDMYFKLNYHIPTVQKIAQKVYPDERKIYVAASLMDIGCANEYKFTGGFNGKEEWDHRKIGVAVLDKLWIENDGDLLSKTYQQIRNAVEFHGDVIPEWVSEEDIEIINAVNLIDSIVTGGSHWRMMYREQQTHAKSVEKGGFIPKENQWSKEISAACLQGFREGKPFDESECKTYTDYFLLAGALVRRNLKSDNKRVVAAQIEVLERPAAGLIYLNAFGEPLKEGEAFYKRNARGKFVIANKEGEADED